MFITELHYQLLDFIALGGLMLWVILLVAILLWTLLLNHHFFIRNSYPNYAKQLLAQWQNRDERRSWQARQIREALASQATIRLHHSLALIKTLIAICPLLGLLGTVSGMIEVFDVMASLGTSNARAMASGVSAATIPTMAGMVVALSGIYLSARLNNRADRESRKFRDQLTSSI